MTLSRRPLPKARLLANAEERARAVLLEARSYATTHELVDLVGAGDGDWIEWEEQNQSIRDEGFDLWKSGAKLW